MIFSISYSTNNETLNGDSIVCGLIRHCENYQRTVTHLQPRVENSSHYNTCSPYRIYSVSRQSDIRVLEDEGFCGDDGKTIRNVDMFPNGKYGLHGQHLRVATFEVNIYSV